MNDAVINLRNVPRTLRDQFAAECRRHGTDMTKTIIQFMREYVKANQTTPVGPGERRKSQAGGKEVVL